MADSASPRNLGAMHRRASSEPVSAKVTTSGFFAYASGASIKDRPFQQRLGPGRRMTLYLVRHAQAAHNVAEAAARTAVQRRGGSEAEQEAARKEALKDPRNADASLSEAGAVQTEHAATEFHELLERTQYPYPQAVLVSPLERTLETASRLFPGHDNIVCLERLREKRTGLPCDERKACKVLQKRHPGVDFEDLQALDTESDVGYTFRKGATPTEGNDEVRTRTGFLLPFLRRLPAEAVAVVAHKGFLREFFNSVSPLLEKESEDLKAVFCNAELRVVEVHWEADCDDPPPALTAHSLAHAIRMPGVDVASTPRSLPELASLPSPLPLPTPPTLQLPLKPAAQSLHKEGARFIVGSSSLYDTDAAITAAWESLLASLDSREPEFVAIFCSPHVDGTAAFRTLRRHAAASRVSVAGGTYAEGALVRDSAVSHVTLVGFCGLFDGVGVGASSINDVDEDACSRPTYNAARAAGERAARDALREAQGCDVDSQPDIIQSFLSPGHEEAVLDGVRAVFGEFAALFGGSIADDSVVDVRNDAEHDGPGKPFQLYVTCDGEGRLFQDRSAVLLVAMRLRDNARAFAGLSHLYAPTTNSGRITKCNGRLLSRIDDRPAASVIGEWIDGIALQPGPCLRKTALYPLAVPIKAPRSDADDIGLLQRCIHMKYVTKHGDISCFADLDAGVEVTMLQGKPATLVGAVAEVIRAAVECAPFKVLGALVDVCAGAATALQEPRSSISNAVDGVLPSGASFVVYFSFGEQGMVARRASHGNLMIGVTLFGECEVKGVSGE